MVGGRRREARGVRERRGGGEGGRGGGGRGKLGEVWRGFAEGAQQQAHVDITAPISIGVD